MNDLKPDDDFINCPRCDSENCQDIPKKKEIVGTLIATVVFSALIYVLGFHFPRLWYLLIAMPAFALFLMFKPTQKRLCLDCKKVWEYRVPKGSKS